MADSLQPSKRALRAEIRERRRTMTQLERENSAQGLLTSMKRIVDEHAASRIAGKPAGDRSAERAGVEEDPVKDKDIGTIDQEVYLTARGIAAAIVAKPAAPDREAAQASDS